MCRINIKDVLNCLDTFLFLLTFETQYAEFLVNLNVAAAP